MGNDFLNEYGVTFEEFGILRDAAEILVNRDTRMASITLFNHVANQAKLSNKTTPYAVFETIANDLSDRMESIEELAAKIFHSNEESDED